MPIPYETNIDSLEISIYDMDKGLIIHTIPHYNLVEYNVVWSIEKILNEGNLVFYDYDHIFSVIPMLSSYKLMVKIKDRVENTSTQMFNIFDIEKSLYKQQVNIIRILFIDEYHYGLSRLTYSKGYKQSTIKTILEDAIKLIDDSILNKKEIVSSFSLKLDIVIPSNMNFLQWINHIKIKYGFGIFISKQNIHIIDYKNILNEATKKLDYKFLFNHYQSNYPLKIYDINIDILNKMKSLNDNPSLKIIDVLYYDKQVRNKIQLKHYNTSVNDFGKVGMVTNKFDTLGFQSRVLVDDFTVEVPYYWDLLNNYMVDISIKGVNEIDLNLIIQLELMIPGSTQLDNMLTGEWLISRVSEKIQGLSFTQKVTLVNPCLNK